MKTKILERLIIRLRIPVFSRLVSPYNLFGGEDENKVQIKIKAEKSHLDSYLSKNWHNTIPVFKKTLWVYFFNNKHTQFLSIKDMIQTGLIVKDLSLTIENFIPAFYYFLKEGQKMQSAFNAEFFPRNLIFLLSIDGIIIKVEAEYYSPDSYWNIYENILDVNEVEYINPELPQIGMQEKGFILRCCPKNN